MSLTYKISIVFVLALIELAWTAYIFLWGKSAKKQIDDGEASLDDFKQPFGGSLFILYHFPAIALLTIISKRDEASGLKTVILTFCGYTILFLFIIYFI